MTNGTIAAALLLLTCMASDLDIDPASMLLAKSADLLRCLPGHGTMRVQDRQAKVHRGRHCREQIANADFANSVGLVIFPHFAWSQPFQFQQ